jgi:glutaryl-CoA dehydrogenase (non-decarboxylating)
MGRLLVWRAGWLKNQGSGTRARRAWPSGTRPSIASRARSMPSRSTARTVTRTSSRSSATCATRRPPSSTKGTSQLHTLIQADYALGYREDRPLRCEPWPAQGWEAARA